MTVIPILFKGCDHILRVYVHTDDVVSLLNEVELATHRAKDQPNGYQQIIDRVQQLTQWLKDLEKRRKEYKGP